MLEKYVHNPVAINEKKKKFKTLMESYENTIMEIQSKINEIEASNAWIDVQVKTEFIASCNEYIKILQILIEGLNKNFRYMDNKTGDLLLFEQTFTKVMSNVGE